MKTLISLLFVFSSLQSFAGTEYVDGRGYVNGHCQGGGMGMICIDRLKQDAERDADRDADMRCRLKNGTLLTYTRYCSTFCNPSYVPIDNDAWVNCSADCRYSCDIRN